MQHEADVAGYDRDKEEKRAMARMYANKVTSAKWNLQPFKESLLCPANESVLTFCCILGQC